MRRNQMFEHDQMKQNLDDLHDGNKHDEHGQNRFWPRLIGRLIVLGVILLIVILVIVLR